MQATHVYPQAGRTYGVTLTVSNGGGTRIVNAIVLVENPSVPLVDQFKAMPARVLAGQSVTLVWSCRFASKARIEPPLDACGGGIDLPPVGTCTFTPQRSRHCKPRSVRH